WFSSRHTPCHTLKSPFQLKQVAQPRAIKENRLWLWLSRWLSFQAKLAGMDENRTHPGRLSSAPQTVLKTAESTSSRSSPTFCRPILEDALRRGQRVAYGLSAGPRADAGARARVHRPSAVSPRSA